MNEGTEILQYSTETTRLYVHTETGYVRLGTLVFPLPGEKGIAFILDKKIIQRSGGKTWVRKYAVEDDYSVRPGEIRRIDASKIHYHPSSGNIDLSLESGRHIKELRLRHVPLQTKYDVRLAVLMFWGLDKMPGLPSPKKTPEHTRYIHGSGGFLALEMYLFRFRGERYLIPGDKESYYINSAGGTESPLRAMCIPFEHGQPTHFVIRDSADKDQAASFLEGVVQNRIGALVQFGDENLDHPEKEKADLISLSTDPATLRRPILTGKRLETSAEPFTDRQIQIIEHIRAGECSPECIRRK